ncbi:hypothetical protein CASFOL_031992 [Castilleja foliolosa]|uniref:CBM20 domain-containing protein n=1 Tax=Castilleja foliolosa TaxID=1961234 RepID=A0ABD3BZP5_9LAMI
MKALVGSYLKFVKWKQREKERVIFCSTKIAQTRQKTCFFTHQKRVRNGFCLAASIEHKGNLSICASLSAQTNGESEKIQTIQTDKSKTVRVRFKLNKECTFGQQFVIVGDDPIVGSWDPSDGVPLIWSKGHVWTAEMDIPSGKVIKYKFILKGDGENILWQPGPDRVLETWFTDKTITVFEDWDDPEIQNIVEEEIVANVKEESFVDSDLFIVAENLNVPMLDKETDVIDELANANGHKDHLEIITDEKGIDYLSLEYEKRIILGEGVRVLVPGLISTPSEEIEGARNEVEIIERVDKTSVEIEDSVKLEERSETVMINQTEQINGAENILESNFQWGRRTLQKFLYSLGLQ